ncbi:vacuolar protein [Cryptococcus deuterogattii R265]|uniref:vacuolar protein n=1 Tax=Cryptococcus deuterogattii (strain R265) TaxID=294750 RepID=UPI0019370C03|nr:vacuolar protein [Cryptococcus deuterogattii R265]
MSLIHNCSGVVIRCFKHVEHFADWLTGAAGPVFVFFCWLLIGSGGVLFFDVVARDLSLLSLLLLSPLLVLVPLNLYLQYYLVTHVPPGFPAPRASGPDENMSWIVPDTKSIWAPERWGFKKMIRPLTGGRQAEGTAETGRRVRRCRKCDGPKPEVGLHNQRHFVLFMAWLSIGCWVTAVLGYHRFLDTFKYRSEWNSWTPKLGWTIIWVLAVAIGIAVPILTLWHLYMVSNGETSIESHDNAYLASKAKSEGLIYLNPYDLGRRRNLQLFFNLGPGGYSPITLLFPFLVPPATNGWSFYRRPLPTHPLAPMKELHAPELGEGLIARTNASSGRGLGLGLGLDVGDSVGSHAEDGLGGYVMGDDGSLTDDEEGGGGYID